MTDEKINRKRSKASSNQADTVSPQSTNPAEKKRMKAGQKGSQSKSVDQNQARENWLVDELHDELEESFLSSSSASMFNGRMSRLIFGLESSNPMASLVELNDFLNMAPEDGVFGFPAEAAVRNLISLLSIEEKIDSDDDPVTRTLLASRCLTAMLDAVPRAAQALSSDEESISVICDKLLTINNIDFAEQVISLIAKLVSKGGAEILVSTGGILALLANLEFYSMHSQIQALTAAQEALAEGLGAMEELDALVKVLAVRTDHQGLQLVSNMILGIVSDSPECLSEELLTIVIGKLNSASLDLLEIVTLGAEQHRDFLLKQERLRSLILSESIKDGNFLHLAVSLLPKMTLTGKGELQIRDFTDDARNLVLDLVNRPLPHANPNTLHVHVVNKIMGGACTHSVDVGKFFIFAETISAVAGTGALRPSRVIAACQLLRGAPLRRQGVMEALKELCKYKKKEMLHVHAAAKRVMAEIRASAADDSMEMTIFEFLEIGVFEILEKLMNSKSAESLACSWLSEPGIFSKLVKLVIEAFARAQHSLPCIDHHEDFTLEKSLRIKINFSTGAVTILADALAPVRSVVSFTLSTAGVPPSAMRVKTVSGAELDLDSPLCLALGKVSVPQGAATPCKEDNEGCFYASDESEIVIDQDKFAKAFAPSRASMLWSQTHQLVCSESDGVPVKERVASPHLEIVTLDRMGQFLARLEKLMNSSIPEFFSKTVAALLRVIAALSLFSDVFHVHADFTCLEICSRVEAILGSQLRCATGDIPPWVDGIAMHAPFIFSIPIRKQLLALRSFGLSRALHLPSQPRQKVKISRENLPVAAAAALEATAARPDYLVEFEFSGEAGSGSGPTNEFYSLITGAVRETYSGIFMKPASQHTGKLFPAPGTEFTEQWRMLGHLTARALIDGRLVDLDFHEHFWRLCAGEIFSPAEWLQDLDPEMARSLSQLSNLSPKELTNLEISTETCPGVDSLRLMGVSGDTVNAGNLKSYTDAVAAAIVYEGVITNARHFVSAFNDIFPLCNLLSLFRPDEISSLYLGSSNEDNLWTDVVALPGHGYSTDSAVFKWMIEIITELSVTERSMFTRFVTGSHILPTGGFAALRPPLTVARAVVDGCPDSFLPSVMTCANFLKVPEYTSKERLRSQLKLAITEGQGSFHLS